MVSNVRRGAPPFHPAGARGALQENPVKKLFICAGRCFQKTGPIRVFIHIENAVSDLAEGRLGLLSYSLRDEARKKRRLPVSIEGSASELQTAGSRFFRRRCLQRSSFESSRRDLQSAQYSKYLGSQDFRQTVANVFRFFATKNQYLIDKMSARY